MSSDSTVSALRSPIAIQADKERICTDCGAAGSPVIVKRSERWGNTWRCMDCVPDEELHGTR